MDQSINIDHSIKEEIKEELKTEDNVDVTFHHLAGNLQNNEVDSIKLIQSRLRFILLKI